MTTTSANTPFPTSSVSPSTPASSLPSAGNGNVPATKTEADTAAVLSRVVQGAHSAIDRMAETAAPAVQKLQDGVSAAGETLSKRASDARELGDEWMESLRSSVREHPLAALGTALALGVLVARLSR